LPIRDTLPSFGSTMPKDQDSNSNGDSASRVAYDLMRLIGIQEKKTTKENARKYLLDLYAECYEAAVGSREITED
jgi:hypothetical protein